MAIIYASMSRTTNNKIRLISQKLYSFWSSHRKMLVEYVFICVSFWSKYTKVAFLPTPFPLNLTWNENAWTFQTDLIENKSRIFPHISLMMINSGCCEQFSAKLASIFSVHGWFMLCGMFSSRYFQITSVIINIMKNSEHFLNRHQDRNPIR